MLRVASNSEIRLGNLQFRRYQIQVAIGTVTFRVLRDGDAQVEVNTPLSSLRPLGRGAYRVTVREDGSAEITVRDGEAEVATARGTERLRAGGTMMLRGSQDDPEFQMVGEPGQDEFDRWNVGRDHELERARSPQYVSNDVYGAEDLDSHGRWVNEPQYGNVWMPTVEPGWAPYRSGRWAWEDYYGWTWISADPWGWAPYHYGRWFYGSTGWCWFPGARYERQYWSPALVAFFGFGGRGGGGGFGFGNVGWVPLAPYERLNPWWGRGYNSRTFINNTNIVNNTNITNIYRNARVGNGITGVNSGDFGRHGGQYMGVNGHNLRDAGLVRGGLPVAPDRSSLRMADREVRSAAYPQSRATQFYSRGGNAAPSQRTPFSQQQQPAGQSGNGAPHAWRSFGEPVHGSVGGMGGGAAPAGNAYQGGGGSWSRFSDGQARYPQAGNSQTAPVTSGSGWGRSNSQPAYSAPRGGNSLQSAPADRASYRGYDSGRGSAPQSSPVRINPPIVRDRSNSQPSSQPAPRSSGGGGGSRAPSGGGGGGTSRAPSGGSSRGGSRR